ncbi:MAG: c-type cytochrome, partial [Phycisphaeraceae bacterium]|nr:c-type cytochrome [Phycisphaeraceae bacterium]
RPEGPGRNWTLEQLVALEPKTKKGRDFENGKKMYAAAMCAQCHVLAGKGGLGGPDLTQLAGRYSFKDMIDNIIHPSKVISDQYQNVEITKKDGTRMVGRVVGEENGKLKVMPTPLNPDFTLNIPKSQVAEMKPSKVSSMMPGLLNALNEEEVLNLLAYIRSAGKASDPAFK